MEILIQKLEDGTFCSSRLFFVDGQDRFTPVERAILGEMDRFSRGLTVAMTLCPTQSFLGECVRTGATMNHMPEVMATDIAFGASIRHALQVMRLGTVKEIVWMETPLRGQSQILTDSQHFYFKAPNNRYIGDDSAIMEVVADSVPGEIGAAVRLIQDLVATGVRYREIALILPPEDEYMLCAQLQMEQAKIPFFLDAGNDISSKSLLRFIQAAFAIWDHHWQLEDVLTLLRTQLLDIPSQKVDAFENYLRTWRPREHLWASAFTLPTRGYGFELRNPEQQEEEAIALGSINEVRAFVWNALQVLKKGDTAREWVEKLNQFLEDNHIPERLSGISNLLLEIGENQLAEENRQLWNILSLALSQCFSIIGNRLMDRRNFIGMLMGMLKGRKVSTIPPALDQVTVGAIRRVRRYEAGFVLITGCDSLQMPSFAESGSLLLPEDLESLKDREVLPDAQQNMEWAYHELYCTLSLPSQKLILLWNSGGKEAKQPSIVIKNLRMLLSSGRRPEYFPVIPLKAGQGSCQIGFLSKEIIESLYGDTLKLSVTRIQKLLTCTYAYFLQYGLNLEKRRVEGFSIPDQGTFVHYVAEQTGKALLSQDIHTVDMSQVEKLATIAAEKFIAGLSGDPGAALHHRLEVLRNASIRIAKDIFEELKQSRFSPLSYEMSFGRNQDVNLPTIIVDGVPVTVNGKVDRVDEWVSQGLRYLRVIDYKTGNPEVNYSKIYALGQIQLPLYLLALTGSSSSDAPAGFLYIPAQYKIPSSQRPLSFEEAESERKKQLSRTGLILDEREVVEAMEPALNHQYIPVRVNADGSFRKGSPIASREEFQLLERHVNSTIETAAQTILSGAIQALPHMAAGDKIPCEYCDFAPGCPYLSGQETPIAIPKMNKSEFFQQISVENVQGEAQ
jgi:ATP-dependent helicase/nuclease subunit B